MIRSELELKISKEQLETLEKRLEEAPSSAKPQMQTWVDLLKKEINEYLTSKENSVTLP